MRGGSDQPQICFFTDSTMPQSYFFTATIPIWLYSELALTSSIIFCKRLFRIKSVV